MHKKLIRVHLWVKVTPALFTLKINFISKIKQFFLHIINKILSTIYEMCSYCPRIMNSYGCKCHFAMLLPSGMHLFINTPQMCRPRRKGDNTKSMKFYIVWASTADTHIAGERLRKQPVLKTNTPMWTCIFQSF